VIQSWRGKRAPGGEHRDRRTTSQDPTALQTQRPTYRDYRQGVGNCPGEFRLVAVNLVAATPVEASESSLLTPLRPAVGSGLGEVRAAATSVASPPMIVIETVELSLPLYLCPAVKSCMGEVWAAATSVASPPWHGLFASIVRDIHGSSDEKANESNTNVDF
jgi:hypothetical protein